MNSRHQQIRFQQKHILTACWLLQAGPALNSSAHLPAAAVPQCSVKEKCWGTYFQEKSLRYEDPAGKMNPVWSSKQRGQTCLQRALGAASSRQLHDKYGWLILQRPSSAGKIFLFLGWRGLSDFKYQVSELVVFQKGSAECGWGITNLMATCHQPWESVKHSYSQDSGNGDFWMDIDQLTRREMEIIWSMKCLLCQTVITEISCQTQISMVLGINREEGMHFLGNA